MAPLSAMALMIRAAPSETRPVCAHRPSRKTAECSESAICGCPNNLQCFVLHKAELTRALRRIKLAVRHTTPQNFAMTLANL